MISQALSYFSPIAALKQLVLACKERRCPVCRKTHHDRDGLCAACLETIELKPSNICTVCGMELNSTDVAEQSCISCQTDPPQFSRLYFYGHHKGLLRELILGWKFNDQYGASTVFHSLISAVCLEIPAQSIPDLIVPVPLHSSRLRKRGFNQSLDLAQAASITTGIPLAAQALTRLRKTAPQSSLSGIERRNNLVNAFTANSSLVSGKKILLVDDVYTTGSTVNECARALRNSGAKQVEIITLSRALI